jgi:hypothetical protein
MKPQRDIASFVLRFTQELWQESNGEPRVEWRGHVRHVQADDELRFTDIAEAMAFIQRSLMELTANSTPGADKMFQDKALRESFKLWERFATSYTEMMVETMQQTVKQSEMLQQQVNEALGQAMRPWWLAPHNQATPEQGAAMAEVTAKLCALEAQLALVTAKLAQLEEAAKPTSSDSGPSK